MENHIKSIQKIKMNHLLSLFLILFTLPLFSQYSFPFTVSSGTNIVDHGIKTLEREINIPESVNKLSVSVDIEHTWVNDLEMTIINPDGDRFTVFSRLGSAECFGCDGDDILMQFYDASPTPYSDLKEQCNDQPAYSGDSKASIKLDSILSGTINGFWAIEIKDYWPHESGRINAIVLEFDNYKEPLCTDFTAPLEGENRVAINTLIEWNASTDATGYLLSLGTESGTYNLFENIDVGLALNYDPGILDCDQDYFVRVIPYNPFGEAIDCTEQYFHTEWVEAGMDEEIMICKGESVQLIATGGTQYSWVPDTFLDDPNIPNPVSTPEESIHYTLIVMNDNGCSDTATISITVPNIEITVDSIYHVRTDLPGFILISDNGPEGTYLYEWTGPNGFSANTQDIDNLGVGCYTLLVTDVVSGCSSELTVCVEDLTDVPVTVAEGDIIVYPNPVFDILIIDFQSRENEAFKVDLIDISGKKLNEWYKDKESRYLQIDMSFYPQGIYEMSCTSGEYIYRSKLFKSSE